MIDFLRRQKARSRKHLESDPPSEAGLGGNVAITNHTSIGLEASEAHDISSMSGRAQGATHRRKAAVMKGCL